MAKTVAAAQIDIPGVGTFETNVSPDPFDARDLEYRPRLEPLPAMLDQRAAKGERYIMRQDGQSCTGHALAAVINTVVAQTLVRDRPPDAPDNPQPPLQFPHVSPYMLYRLARRYDEFQGEADKGSSLRGAFKGWFNHGVALEE